MCVCVCVCVSVILCFSFNLHYMGEDLETLIYVLMPAVELDKYTDFCVESFVLCGCAHTVSIYVLIKSEPTGGRAGERE